MQLPNYSVSATTITRNLLSYQLPRVTASTCSNNRGITHACKKNGLNDERFINGPRLSQSADRSLLELDVSITVAAGENIKEKWFIFTFIV